MLIKGTYHYGNNYKLVIDENTDKKRIDKLVKKYPALKSLVYDNSNKKRDKDSKDSTESGQSK